MTQEEEQYNKEVRAVRGNQERPFGLLEKKFECLKRFREDKNEQDKVVAFAVAVHNRMIR